MCSLSTEFRAYIINTLHDWISIGVGVKYSKVLGISILSNEYAKLRYLDS